MLGLSGGDDPNALHFRQHLQDHSFVLFKFHGLVLLLGDSMKAMRILKAWAIDIILVVTFFSWAWFQDWVKEEDWTRNGKVLATVAAAGVAAGAYISRRFHWSVGLFFAYTILRWVSLRLAPVSMIEVTLITACVFLAVFVYEKDGKNLLGNCLVVDAFLQACLGLVEVIGFFPFLEITNPVVWPPIAALGHPTLLGPYLAVALAFIPGAFGFVKNGLDRITLQLVAAMVILVCIGFTQSTMTVVTLAVVGAIAAGFYLGTRALFAASAGALAIGAVIVEFFPAVGSASGRIPQWEFAWRNLTLLGHGPGTWFPVAFQKTVAETQALEAKGETIRHVQFFGQLHNDWLQGIFEWGWLGMAPIFIGVIVLFTITLKAVLLRRRELFPFAALFWGLAVNALGNFPIHTMPAGGLLAIGAIYLFRYDFEEQNIRHHLESMERNL